MTDLPRFTGGSLGPISFAQMNEVMRRLDALKPLIETAGVSSNELTGLLGGVMLVYAKRKEDPQLADRFEWEEVIVLSGEDADKSDQTPTDVVTFFEQEDSVQWELAKEKAVTRKGGSDDDGDDYAICVDGEFSEGFAICIARNATDGGKRYVLVPLIPTDPSVGGYSGLFRIVNALGEGESIATSDGGEVPAFVYTARRCLFGLDKGQYEIRIIDDELIPFFHIGGPDQINIPPVTGNPTLTPEQLEPGTFFNGTVVNVGVPFEPVYVGYITDLPRLRVEC